jgi:hypothetical protein
MRWYQIQRDYTTFEDWDLNVLRSGLPMLVTLAASLARKKHLGKQISSVNLTFGTFSNSVLPGTATAKYKHMKTHTNIHPCMHTSMHTDKEASKHSCICIRAHACIHMWYSIHITIHVHNVHSVRTKKTYVHIFSYIDTQTYAYIYICVHTNMHAHCISWHWIRDQCIRWCHENMARISGCPTAHCQITSDVSFWTRSQPGMRGRFVFLSESWFSLVFFWFPWLLFWGLLRDGSIDSWIFLRVQFFSHLEQRVSTSCSQGVGLLILREEVKYWFSPFPMWNKTWFPSFPMWNTTINILLWGVGSFDSSWWIWVAVCLFSHLEVQYGGLADGNGGSYATPAPETSNSYFYIFRYNYTYHYVFLHTVIYL